ncbi:MAG: FKBP-type peptidyl-prolyl cis-trans isomerase [Monoraphidium minutum]|nr:MAG: FKBP-type peptidyl-prolyl cis-trans isomerase [Monoraphidium minutum]
MAFCSKATQGVAQRSVAGARTSSAVRVRCSAARPAPGVQQQASRREALQTGVMLAAGLVAWPAAAAPPVSEVRVICDAECVSKLDTAQLVTTASGLQYKDVVVGSGPQAQVGFQAVVHYVAMLPSGRVFENSLERGKPFDVRVGTGQVVPGLDEALTTMRVGGTRRVFVPGELAFPKPLKAAAGRPTVPANSPVTFDVQLLYIPGLDLDEE